MASWLYLFLAIILEVAGTTCMKLSDGFARLLPSIGVAAFYLASLAGLTMAPKQIPVSVAYAVWAGLGTAIISLVGFWYFKEPVTTVKLLSIALIIGGVTGLHLSNSTH